MKLLKTLLIAGLLTTGLTACADYYGDYGPYGPYGYDYGYRDRGMFWQGGHRYCRSLDDPDAVYLCDPY